MFFFVFFWQNYPKSKGAADVGKDLRRMEQSPALTARLALIMKPTTQTAGWKREGAV